MFNCSADGRVTKPFNGYFLALCDVAYPQRRTWWWGWSGRLWTESTSRPTHKGASSSSRLFILVHLRWCTVHRVISRGENLRERGQEDLKGSGGYFFQSSACVTLFIHFHSSYRRNQAFSVEKPGDYFLIIFHRLLWYIVPEHFLLLSLLSAVVFLMHVSCHMLHLSIKLNHQLSLCVSLH